MVAGLDSPPIRCADRKDAPMWCHKILVDEHGDGRFLGHGIADASEEALHAALAAAAHDDEAARC